MKKENLVEQASDIVNNAIEKKMHSNIYGIPLPAKILKYDFATNLADVQCLINISDGQGGFMSEYSMADVPVITHSTNAANIPIKIQTGDEGIVIITPIGIENWLLDGGIQEEHLPTKGGLQNCFFFPSVFRPAEGQLNLLKNLSDQVAKISDSLDKIATAFEKISSSTAMVTSPGAPAPLDTGTIEAMILVKTEITANIEDLSSLKELFDKAYDF